MADPHQEIRLVGSGNTSHLRFYPHGMGKVNMSTFSASKRKLIYVVDDEEFMSDMVREILLLENYEAVSFQDPLEALRSMERANPQPDLLLTDFVMDSLNGMDLIKRCKGLKPSLKTILFSGNVNEEIMRRYDFKPDFFINKPFLPRDLLQKIGQCLNPLE